MEKKRFQGFRPYIWDKMSVGERLFAFWTDIIVAGAGVAFIWWFFGG